jgi:hypothetical protein
LKFGSVQVSVFGVQKKKSDYDPSWKISFRRKSGMSPSGYNEGIWPHIKLLEIQCHFHDVSCSIKLAALAARGSAEH